MAQRPLNVGMIGGGGGAFIVHPHQRAIHFDGTRRVTAAALHPDPKVAMEEAERWPYPITGYRNYDEMIEAESKKPAGQRIDYALIVTPNHVHFDPAMKCIKARIPVFCEKPLTVTLQEADQLVAAVRAGQDPLWRLAHLPGTLDQPVCAVYRHQRPLGRGPLGRFVLPAGMACRPHRGPGLAASPVAGGPQTSGHSCCGGDIGTHALMQLRYVTGLDVTQLQAHMETFVEGRKLDDHFTTYCRLSNGGKALVRATQIAIGHRNDLGIEVNGTKGSLLWSQVEPEELTILLPNQPNRTYYRGAVAAHDGFLGDLPESLMAEPNIPAGHPEAFHDAFARLHRCFEQDVRAYLDNRPFPTDNGRYAQVEDGRMGMAFIAAALASSQQGGAWVDIA